MQNVLESRYTTKWRSSFFNKYPKDNKNPIYFIEENNFDSEIFSYSYLNLPNLLTFNKIPSLNCNLSPEKIMILEENSNNLRNVLILEDLLRIFSYYICISKKRCNGKIETVFVNFFLKFSKKFHGKNIITEAQLKNIMNFSYFRNLMRGNILKELSCKNSEKDSRREVIKIKLLTIEKKKVFNVKPCLKCFKMNSIFSTQIALIFIDKSNQDFFKNFVYFLKKKFRLTQNYLVDEAVIMINQNFKINKSKKIQEILLT